MGASEILHADAQRLTDVFNREGATGLKTFIDTRVGMQIAGRAHPDAGGRQPAAHRRQPAAVAPTVPAQPGMYNVTLELERRADGVRGRARPVFRAAITCWWAVTWRCFAPLTRHFWTGLAAAVAVLSIAGVLGGVLTRRAILARVHSIRQTVLGHHAGRSEPPPAHAAAAVTSSKTLSHTINGMLDQIEQLINGVRDVSNSIAHDLRTPLAELRSRLEELSLTRPPSEETFAEVDGAVADVDRVIRIFNALLRLAEIDTGMRRSGFVQVNANELAAEVVEFYSPAAEVKDVALSFASNGPVSVSGDPDPVGAGRRQPHRQCAQVRGVCRVP